MDNPLPDDINTFKRLLAEQEALIQALQEKRSHREREIDHRQSFRKGIPLYRPDGSRPEPASDRKRRTHRPGIGTCKLNGIDPEQYLRHVLGVIADWPINRVSELLPCRITLPGE